MGIIDFNCGACGWNWRGHIGGHCVKCGSNPIRQHIKISTSIKVSDFIKGGVDEKVRSE